MANFRLDRDVNEISRGEPTFKSTMAFMGLDPGFKVVPWNDAKTSARTLVTGGATTCDVLVGGEKGLYTLGHFDQSEESSIDVSAFGRYFENVIAVSIHPTDIKERLSRDIPVITPNPTSNGIFNRDIIVTPSGYIGIGYDHNMEKHEVPF